MKSNSEIIKWGYAFKIWISLIITTILVGGIVWAICVVVFTFIYSQGFLPRSLINTDIRLFIKGTLVMAIFASQIYAIKLVLTQKYKDFEIKIIEKNKA